MGGKSLQATRDSSARRCLPTRWLIYFAAKLRRIYQLEMLRRIRDGRLLGLETTPQHNRKHDAPPRRKSRGRGFRFLTKQDAEGLAWKYFCGRSGVLPPPPAEMSPKDLAELVVWRAEGHALKASWCTGRALEAAQNRAAAGTR